MYKVPETEMHIVRQMNDEVGPVYIYNYYIESTFGIDIKIKHNLHY